MHKIICAWCNTVLQEGTLPVSHSICPHCLILEKDELDGICNSSRESLYMVMVCSKADRNIISEK